MHCKKRSLHAIIDEKQLRLIKDHFVLRLPGDSANWGGLEEKSRPRGARAEVCQEKETQFIFHRSASVILGLPFQL